MRREWVPGRKNEATEGPEDSGGVGVLVTVVGAAWAR